MTDQEGGYVRRLPGAPDHSEAWIGERATASDRAYQARTAGTGAAQNLRGFGLNVNLAPVLDVYRAAGDFDDQYQRSYSMNPAVVSALGADFIRAQQAGGVAATAKHFPGLGAATASQDTDDVPVTIHLSAATIRAVDEYPYKAAIAAGVKLVMVSWAKYPSLGTDLPAGLAPAIVRGELRKRLGFSGVTVTDAIGAGALASYGSTGNRSLKAAEAGMELILASGESPGEGEQSMDALEGAYKSGALGGPDVPGVSHADPAAARWPVARSSARMRSGRLHAARALTRYDRCGSSCRAQVLPSGSAKVTNEPHGWTSISLACTPCSIKRLARRRDVGYDHLHTALRSGLHLRDADAHHDRAGRAGRRQLDEPEPLTDLVVMIGVEADLIHVERLGAVDVGNGNGHELDLPVHDSDAIAGY